MLFFQGWMNEMSNYDPDTYHATLTHSVFVRLEGSTIRLSKPNHNIARRSAHNDPKPDVSFVSQKIYELGDSKVCFHNASPYFHNLLSFLLLLLFINFYITLTSKSVASGGNNFHWNYGK